MVLAYRLTAEEKLVDIPLDPERPGDSTLAGFESMRRSFYAGELAMGLGLKLLPQLQDSDLWIYGRDLAVLQQEVDLLLRNLAPVDLRYCSYRLGNISNAIARALVYGDEGCVYIGS